MGNKQSTTIPQLPSSSSFNASEKIETISDMTEQRVRMGFRQSCNFEGKVTRKNFNDTLSILEDLGLRRLRETPLGDRLFDIFDKDRSNAVDEDEFVKGVAILTGSDQIKKINLTYQAYDSKGLGRVMQDDVIQIVVDSWLAAFRFLKERIANTPSAISAEKPSTKYLMEFSNRHLKRLREVVAQSLQPYVLQSSGTIYPQAFAGWASIDRTISASCGSFSVQVAVTFLNIEKPPLNLSVEPMYASCYQTPISNTPSTSNRIIQYSKN